MRTLHPTTNEEVCAAIREHAPVLAHGAFTKEPLAAVNDVTRIDMRRLDRMIEYDPGEFTFTAQAGMSVKAIENALAEHGQYLPFDPPLMTAGATIGGTLASGLNGSGRLRFGGLRDFVVGVRFADGAGRVVRGGGKVVKNAAGFDLPKLMVGSMGRLGVLLDLTFKVFPKPVASQTIRVQCHHIDDSLNVLAELARLPLDLEALDLEPPQTLLVRVSGNTVTLGEHARRVADTTERPCEILTDLEDGACWHGIREFSWVPDDYFLMKVPLSPLRIPELEHLLPQSARVLRRYSVAGNVAWLAWPASEPRPPLDRSGLTGYIVCGPRGIQVENLRTGANAALGSFPGRIKSTLDPRRSFPPLV